MWPNRSLWPLLLFMVAALALSWFFSNILTYLVVSIVIATVLKPVVVLIDKVHIAGQNLPRFLIILVAFGLLVGVLALFVVQFVPLIEAQVDIISGLQGDTFESSVQAPLQRVEELLIRYHIALDREPGFLLEQARTALTTLLNNVQISFIVNSLLGITGEAFIFVMAVIFISFFLLYEPGILRRFLISMIPNRFFEVSIAAMFKVEKLLTNYLLGLVMQMISVFTIASIGLTIVGVDYAVTIAAFAAVANLIPYLGPILGGSFGIIVGLTTSNMAFGGVDELLFFVVKVFSVFAIVQLTDNMVLQPFIFSRSVKAHPLEIFIIIFVGATLAGIIGMVLAIPVYTLFRVTFIEFYTGYKGYTAFRLKP